MLGLSISGTLGVFVTQIPLDVGLIMSIRTLIGSLFLLGIFLLSGREFSLKALGKNLPRLVVSGSLFGFSGLFIFKSYGAVGVGLTSIIYALNPVFIFMISLVFLREGFSYKKFLGLMVSVAGLVLINGASMTGLGLNMDFKYGILAAITYALMSIINKKIKGLDIILVSLVQLFVASVLIFAYLLLTGSLSFTWPGRRGLIYLGIISFLHTGYAMMLYFEGLQNLPAQSVALLSYIESLSALLASSLVLKERLGPVEILGAVLIIGGAIVGELVDSRGRRSKDDIGNGKINT